MLDCWMLVLCYPLCDGTDYLECVASDNRKNGFYTHCCLVLLAINFNVFKCAMYNGKEIRHWGKTSV